MWFAEGSVSALNFLPGIRPRSTVVKYICPLFPMAIPFCFRPYQHLDLVRPFIYPPTLTAKIRNRGPKLGQPQLITPTWLSYKEHGKKLARIDVYSHQLMRYVHTCRNKYQDLKPHEPDRRTGNLTYYSYILWAAKYLYIPSPVAFCGSL